MKIKKLTLIIINFIMISFLSSSSYSQVGIGILDPNPSSMLDIHSTTKGMLIPRMTIIERDNISEPAEGLQIYNTTNNTSDIYSNGVWKSFSFSTNSNLVYVYSLADLPTPVSGGITLDATKMYVFSGMVDISPNYIMMNGAGLRGTDPQKDGVTSSVAGAVLRSTDTSVFMESFAVAPLSSVTKAYDFSDSTGTKFCNLFAGCSVIEVAGATLGVGQISGFEAVTYVKNYWNVTDGLKLTGNIGKFAGQINYMKGITNGAAIEFLPGLTVQDVDLSSNYFFFTGQTGIKVNAGATVNRGRLTTNMFRGVTTPLDGIDSYSAGWSMKQNSGIPDSRAFSFIYFNGNTDSTSLPTSFLFYKIQGSTTTVDEKRFTATDNKITYTGVEPIVGKVSVVISAKAPTNNANFSIALGKNAEKVVAPVSSMASTVNRQSFQIILNTEVALETGDFLTVYLRSSTGENSLLVEELQFRVTD